MQAQFFIELIKHIYVLKQHDAPIRFELGSMLLEWQITQTTKPLRKSNKSSENVICN